MYFEIDTGADTSLGKAERFLRSQPGSCGLTGAASMLWEKNKSLGKGAITAFGLLFGLGQ